MPPRSKVYGLPPALRDELNARLVANGFADYRGLEDWLKGQGYSIGKSALADYGQDLKEDFDAAMSDVKKATELARAFANSDPDEQASLVDATARIAQESLLRITIALRKMEEDPISAARQISSVSRALADLGRVTISQRKFAQEVRERVNAAAAAAEKIAKKGGLSADAVAEIRGAILGIPQ